jgi:DNA integrity scanning protein DisA with diadenylate cyclase activity
MGGRIRRAQTDELSPQLRPIKAELELAGVRLPTVPGISESAILEELAYALAPPIHEEFQPSFGAICAPPLGLQHARLKPFLDVPASAETSTASNGTTSFSLVVSALRKFVVFPSYVGGEFNLTTLASDITGIVIQRDVHGTVRIFTGDAVYVNQGRKWWRKHAWRVLLKNVREHVPQGDDNILEQILAFSIHVLSPSHTGATIVWWLTDIPTGVYEPRHQLAALGLRVAPEYLATIQHLLSQHDGATIVSPSGEIVATGVHLQASDTARHLISETRGTRHTSAIRYSYDEARVVVITISQDGPISVFSDGARLGEVQVYSALDDAHTIMKEIPAKLGQAYADSWERVCTGCGKTMRIEALVIAGWKDKEEAHCQVCRTEVGSRMCFKIDAYVVKRL